MTSHTEALTGGPLRAAISDEISHLLRRHAGQGPTQARTYLQDDLIVCLLQDTLTTGEQTLATNGHEANVLDTRGLFQGAMRDELVEAVERLSGHKVIAFMSQNHINPDLAAELFVLEPNPSA